MKNLGYSGIVVTDHFFNGNSGVPKDLPWNERVEMYCSGYEAALEAAKGQDFDVFFGIEFNFEGDEYLLYGLDKEWLLSHPDILLYTRYEVYNAVKEAGGVMIQAHPFRERDYLSAIHLCPSCSDGIEVYNASNKPYQNAIARVYASTHPEFVLTGGSDIHFFHKNEKGGIAFDRKPENYEDFCAMLLGGEALPVSLRDDTNFVPVTEIDEQTKFSKDPYLPIINH